MRISGPTVALFVAVPLMLITGCEKAVDEGAIRPLEAAFDGRQKASLEAARSAVGAVRLALMARQARDSGLKFPDVTEIRDYETLRQALPEANLPEDMAAAGWDPSAGVSYSSDGATFILSVMLPGGGRMTATPGGVAVERSVP